MPNTFEQTAVAFKAALVRQLVERWPDRFNDASKASELATQIVMKINEIVLSQGAERVNRTERLAQTIANAVRSDLTNTRALVTEWISIPTGIDLSHAVMEQNHREILAKILDLIAPQLSGGFGIPYVGPVLGFVLNLPKKFLPPLVSTPIYYACNKVVHKAGDLVRLLPFVPNRNPAQVVVDQGQGIVREAMFQEVRRAFKIFMASWVLAFFLTSLMVKVQKTSVVVEPGRTALSHAVVFNLGVSNAVMPVPNSFFGGVVFVVVVYVLQKVVAGVIYVVIAVVTQQISLANPPLLT
jgi:hypothetical protein